ncbi:hypothetical protein ZYGR_0AK03140 [Zygosaccharomyces rouxii]|uniref:Uncharacterized protein n=1 Tax=Zygosaccharomyces rouxii TaxID=4956 RepID=A0A1Q3ADR1_ZYGRO|nr:hypothetical protein ZYGR_0AK03140 [Zygosaccharomyces rouxii]
MMHFRKKSTASGDSQGSGGNPQNPKLSKEDEEKWKIRTASVADPILEAVQEAQPFEQAADAFQDPNPKSYFSGLEGSNELRDIFGQPIGTPDISNPTRARDERPLDTIRGFEYAVSGDPSWASQLETPQYGFRVRPDFPLMTTNPYSMDNGAGTGSAPVYSEQAVYTAPAPSGAGEGTQKKKKKRGLFGRKKKDN